MEYLFIFLLLSTLIIACILVYIASYDKISQTSKKIDKAQEQIEELLNKKYALMCDCYKIIKKNIKKKDYLKDFNELKVDKLTSYELNNELDTTFETMDLIKDNYKSLNTKEYKKLLNSIYEINENLIASENFFNKYNNVLIKQLTGVNKIVAKITNIKVRTSYEIKEPSED